jgi:preprotein translocase subunit SecB
MKIQLKSWKISSLKMALLDNSSNRDSNSFDLVAGNYFSEEDGSHFFGVTFKVSIQDKQFDLEVEALYQFELVDEPVTEAFKLSTFPKVNAPAIAFPYLRAFVSNLTLQAGLQPVILPSINFAELAAKSASQVE